jgi:hypothetical protein
MWYETLAFNVRDYYVSERIERLKTASNSLQGMCFYAIERLAKYLPIRFEALEIEVKFKDREITHAVLRINHNLLDPTIKQFFPDCEEVMFKEENYPLEIIAESEKPLDLVEKNSSKIWNGMDRL